MQEMDNSESGDDGYIVNERHYVLGTDDATEQGDNTDDSSQDMFAKNTLLREQDRFLPIANIAKIMKRAIPANGKIAKDAREIIQECVSEFISFVTSEASDRCHFEKRKTINGEDILYAMTTLGFDNYVEPLKLYLQKYREATLNNTKIEKPASTELSYESNSKNTPIQTHIQIDIGQQTDNVICSYPSNWNML